MTMVKSHACVVGSGPAGLTCAYILLKRGLKVTLLDFGNIPKGAAHGNIDRYQTNVNRDDLISVKDLKLNRRRRETDIIPTRADFIFNYFYADTNQYIIGQKINAIANISLAMGGLSNLWGGAILPATAPDIADWPVSLDELRPYYKEILEFMPLSAADDGLSRRFQFQSGRPHNFPLGPQAADFLRDLESGRTDLESSGIYFGRAKLAIDPGLPVSHPNYTYGAIFNSAVAMKDLMKNENFKYIPEIFVKEIKESAGEVQIVHVKKSDPGERLFKADRVFIACGPIATTQIILKSLRIHEKEFELKSNQNVIFPFLRYKRHAGISRRPPENIIQLFIDMNNAETHHKFAHIQVYQYGDYVLEPVRRILGRLTPLFAAVTQPVLERIMIMQSILHSDSSDRVAVKLSFKKNENTWKVDLQGRNNPKTPEACRKVLDVLNKHRSQLRGYVPKSILFIDPPGASNHMGGAFPMRADPGEYETDIMGRLPGLKRTHIVDSTILPSLPATPFTYTIMANAARISTLAAEQMSRN